jgi:AbrB family looped-hinge helix DNA binding protein
MVKATVSSKGQVVIPKEVRDRLNLKPGTQLSLEVHGESLIMKRAVSDLPDWRSMRGMFKDGPDLLKDLQEERAAEIARDDARARQDR